MDGLICETAHPSEDVKCFVYRSNCYDMEYSTMCVQCLCKQAVWLVVHIMWVYNVHNAHFGVCLEGSNIHKKDLEFPLCKGGEVIAVSCQSALIGCIRVCNIYVRALRPCVSEVVMGLCCYGEGTG